MLSSKTYELQEQLAEYCRSGKNEPKTSIQEHTYQYRRLISNIFTNSLNNAFPMAKVLVGKDNWAILIKDFFENHNCQTPQVWKMPFEFYTYYMENPHALQAKFPQLTELLLFEWLEIEVYTMADEEIPPFAKEGDALKEVLIPNPEIKIQPLTYPWHKKKVKQITDADKGQYLVTIHRNHYTKKVKFNELSYPFVEMLLEVNERECTFDDLIPMVAEHEKDEAKQKEAVHIFLNFCLKQNLILGYKA